MTLGTGDKLPEATFGVIDNNNKMQELTTEEIFKNKKVILLGVPGAFSPTCSLEHVPSFANKISDLKQKGIDSLVIVAVNDAFVMNAWGQQYGYKGKAVLLADGSASFVKACGFDIDLTKAGMGVRSRRFSAVIDNQVIKALKLEEGGDFTITSAEQILSSL